jgi:dipeptidyl aminopeptidase/acylaminoacyl peptidase
MRRRLAAALALTLAAGLAAPAPAQTPDRRVQGTATLENIPPIPDEVMAAVQRYQSARQAVLADWLADGSLLIATRFGATPQIHRVAQPLGARTQLTFAAEPISEVHAVPGSDRFVYSRDSGGDEWFQLYVQDGSGAAVSFTEPGSRNSDAVVSRDGRRVYWARSTKGSGEYAILAADIANPASRRVVLEEKAGSIFPADVSDDGTRLLMVREVSNREHRLRVLDLASGKVSELTPGAAATYEDAVFTRGGKTVLVRSNKDSDARRILEIDVATGKATPVSGSSAWDVEALDVSPDGRLMAWAVNEEGYSTIGLRDLGSGRDLSLPAGTPRGVVTALQFSQDSRRLAFSIASPTTPGDVYSVDVTGGGLTRWTASELGPIDPKTLVTPKLVRFKSFDGLSVPAFVYRPAGAAPGARTPVLISIHGGPEGQARPGWSPSTQYYADQLGATVIVPNVRGSDGYGRKYIDLDNGPKREDSVKDIGALIDWVATQPDLDAGRIAVIGGSYGGYMVLASMTHYSDRLAGGVELFGISNWVSFLEHTEAYRRDNRRGEYGDERVPAMRAVFEKISPMANVARITKPMLVQQGVNDPRVPKSESDQVVAALRARGVPVSYLVFADEGHGWRKRPNQETSLAVETVFLRQLFAGR